MNKHEAGWFVFLVCVAFFVIVCYSCDPIPITQDDDWAFQETTTLVQVGFTPEAGFFGSSALMLEFENGLVLIDNGVEYFDKKDFRLGAKYDIYEHRATKEIKVRIKIMEVLK